MADQRYCEIRDNRIVNTLVVDPDTPGGSMFLAIKEAEGALMLPEAEALEQYPPD